MPPEHKRPMVSLIGHFRGLTTSKSKKNLHEASKWSLMSFPTDASGYELGEQCGKGVSATVYCGVCKTNGHKVAIKRMDLDEIGWGAHWEEVVREAQTMATHHHPNLLPLLCSFIHQNELWMVEPYISHGSVLNIMKYSHNDGLDEMTIAAIMYETLKGLDYLHRNGMIHRDVKAGNILVDRDGAVYLADFGVSAQLDKRGGSWGQSTRNTFIGTPCWMAPEVMEQSNYDLSADIWSFGITLLELAHGHAPFQKYPPMKVVMMTVQEPPPSLDSEPSARRFSRDMHDLVAVCLRKDHTKRPTASELLGHRFFKVHGPKDPHFLERHLLADLPDVTTRVRRMQRGDARLGFEQACEEVEQSNEEYVKGLSAWNFDVAKLKREAELLPPLMEEEAAVAAGEGDGEVAAPAVDGADHLGLLSGYSSRDLNEASASNHAVAGAAPASPVVVDLSTRRSASPATVDERERRSGAGEHSGDGGRGLPSASPARSGTAGGASDDAARARGSGHGGVLESSAEAGVGGEASLFAPHPGSATGAALTRWGSSGHLPAVHSSTYVTPAGDSAAATVSVVTRAMDPLLERDGDMSEATIGREVRGAAGLARDVSARQAMYAVDAMTRTNGVSAPHPDSATPGDGPTMLAIASTVAIAAMPAAATEVNVAKHTRALEAAAAGAATATAMAPERCGRFTKRACTQPSEAGSVAERPHARADSVSHGSPPPTEAEAPPYSKGGGEPIAGEGQAATEPLMGSSAHGKAEKRQRGRFHVSRTATAGKAHGGGAGAAGDGEAAHVTFLAEPSAGDGAPVSRSAPGSHADDAVGPLPMTDGNTSQQRASAGDAGWVQPPACAAAPSARSEAGGARAEGADGAGDGAAATAAVAAAAAEAASVTAAAVTGTPVTSADVSLAGAFMGANAAAMMKESRKASRFKVIDERGVPFHQPDQRRVERCNSESDAARAGLPSASAPPHFASAPPVDPLHVVTKKLTDLMAASQAQQDAMRMLMSAVSEASKGKDGPLHQLVRSPLIAVHLQGSEAHSNALLEENASLRAEIEELKKKGKKEGEKVKALHRDRDILKQQVVHLKEQLSKAAHIVVRGASPSTSAPGTPSTVGPGTDTVPSSSPRPTFARLTPCGSGLPAYRSGSGTTDARGSADPSASAQLAHLDIAVPVHRLAATGSPADAASNDGSPRVIRSAHGGSHDALPVITEVDSAAASSPALPHAGAPFLETEPRPYRRQSSAPHDPSV